jgi:conserved oligomeric Golgi complex subunit 2
MSLPLNASLPIQVEKLIKELPTAPSDLSNAEVPNSDTGTPNGVAGTGVSETQSILLERIASEMNRLKFYISHAQVRVSTYGCHWYSLT